MSTTSSRSSRPLDIGIWDLIESDSADLSTRFISRWAVTCIHRSVTYGTTSLARRGGRDLSDAGARNGSPVGRLRQTPVDKREIKVGNSRMEGARQFGVTDAVPAAGRCTTPECFV